MTPSAAEAAVLDDPVCPPIPPPEERRDSHNQLQRPRATDMIRILGLSEAEYKAARATARSVIVSHGLDKKGQSNAQLTARQRGKPWVARQTTWRDLHPFQQARAQEAVEEKFPKIKRAQNGWAARMLIQSCFHHRVKIDSRSSHAISTPIVPTISAPVLFYSQRPAKSPSEADHDPKATKTVSQYKPKTPARPSSLSNPRSKRKRALDENDPSSISDLNNAHWSNVSTPPHPGDSAGLSSPAPGGYSPFP